MSFIEEKRQGTHRYLFLLVALSIATAWVGTVAFWRILSRGGIQVLDVPIIVLYGLLYLWIAMGFWTATFGFARGLLDWRSSPSPIDPKDEPLPRTAIVMPIYNESVASVFAGLAAMHEDLARTGRGGDFDFFLLSDSTDGAIWLEEERAWAALRAERPGPSGIYYRRRRENTGQKSGNIADFCRRWGGAYRYMIVLDADSVVAGGTMVEMVRRMEKDPQIGILQSPPLPVNRRSLFARLQQFAAHLYGPIFTSGYALWSQVEGNYYGHNAILRLGPFMDCCGLPQLPGQPPLGGSILSHDFVEAALMRRAGWKVIVDHDLQGSYEQCPANLIDFAKRDQRWCQGNLQHLRLIFTHGFRAVSRTHLGMGAMSYLSSPLWAIFLVLVVLGGVSFRRGGQDAGAAPVAVGLFAATMSLLLLPKLWALVLALVRPRGVAGFGGSGKAASSVLLEILFSILIAPLLMAFHTTFVAAAFLGHTVRWEHQGREDRPVTLTEAAASHSAHTIAGLAGALLVSWLAPGMLLWLAPVLAPLALSIPLSMLLGSRRVGGWLQRRRLLVIPQESWPPRILRRQEVFHRRHIAWRLRRPHPFIEVIADPAFNALHIAMLDEQSRPEMSPRLQRLQRVALTGGPSHLSSRERMEILCCPPALQWLHRQAWMDWPVELLERCCP